MVWIVNAEKLKKNIVFGHQLPSSESNELEDYFFINRTKYDCSSLAGAMWYLKSEAEPDGTMVWGHGVEGQMMYL